MGKMLDALLNLQAVERRLADVRGRLRTRRNSVITQEQLVEQLQSDCESLHAQSMEKRKGSDELELELRTREEQVSRLRNNLNTARTNKEYAAILTQMNTLKADNSRIEEEALKIMQEADTIQSQADEVQQQLQTEQQHLEQLRQQSEQETARLEQMIEQLRKERAEAAGVIPPEQLAVFKRMADSYDGEAMAAIEIHGTKPPHSYVCGGCYMSLNAEHANALRVRDEIRTCDNCGRILYLESKTEASPTQ